MPLHSTFLALSELDDQSLVEECKATQTIFCLHAGARQAVSPW